MRRLIRPLRSYSPFWLGVVGALIVGALVFATFAVGTLGVGDDRYEAELAHTAGIHPGDEVRVAGIGVGQVTGAKLEGDHVLVSFRTSSDVHLGQQTKAAVKVSTLLGGRYLELQPAVSGELEGGRIRLANTSVPFDLQNVIQKGTPAIEGIDATKLRAALDAVTGNLQGNGEAVRKTLDGLTELSTLVTKRSDQINQLIISADAVTTMVNDHRSQLFALMGQADALIKILLDRRELIRGVLRDFKTLTAQLRDVLNENRPQLEPLLANLGGVTDILVRTDDAIDRALEALAPTARYVNNAVGNGPYLDLYLPYAIVPDNLLCVSGAVTGCQ